LSPEEKQKLKERKKEKELFKAVAGDIIDKEMAEKEYDGSDDNIEKNNNNNNDDDEDS